MSLSGLFLITFLLVHMSVNLTLLAGPESYNAAAHFMATNPFIKIMEPMLAVGFFVHIFYAFMLTVRNMKSRPVAYKVKNDAHSSSWSSRNMLVLGLFLLLFLIIHMVNFWVKMKITGEIGSTTVAGVEMHDAYTLVTSLFQIWWYNVLYIVSFVLLGFHLTHGFWSAFQTIGMNNSVWFKRLKAIGHVYTLLIVAGFSIVPLYFLLQ
jgi:succinate dehydrogenase / fumarate reductase cytochrome b subunit